MRTRAEMGQFLNDKGLLGYGVEVGTAFGYFAEQILTTWRGHCLYMIDLWGEVKGTQYVDEWGFTEKDFHEMARIAFERVSRFSRRWAMVSAGSPHVASVFSDELFDFVYIDACHFYKAVKADLTVWWPKLKPGGLFAGHDYQADSVRWAVDEFVEGKGKLNVTVPEVSRCLPNDELSLATSWWFFKPT